MVPLFRYVFHPRIVLHEIKLSQSPFLTYTYKRLRKSTSIHLNQTSQTVDLHDSFCKLHHYILSPPFVSIQKTQVREQSTKDRLPHHTLSASHRFFSKIPHPRLQRHSLSISPSLLSGSRWIAQRRFFWTAPAARRMRMVALRIRAGDELIEACKVVSVAGTKSILFCSPLYAIMHP